MNQAMPRCGLIEMLGFMAGSRPPLGKCPKCTVSPSLTRSNKAHATIKSYSKDEAHSGTLAFELLVQNGQYGRGLASHQSVMGDTP